MDLLTPQPVLAEREVSVSMLNLRASLQEELFSMMLECDCQKSQVSILFA